MKKYLFILSIFLLNACKKQVEFPIPDCIQAKINESYLVDSNTGLSEIIQYEYDKYDYYLLVYGTLDNGHGQLLDNQCNTICTVTDALTCPKLENFWTKAKVVKVIFE